MMNEKKNQGVHEIKAINHFLLVERNSKLESQWFSFQRGLLNMHRTL